MALMAATELMVLMEEMEEEEKRAKWYNID